MELTKKLLEDRIVNVHEQGIQAANVVQQAIGAELMLRELLQEMLLREAIDTAESDEADGTEQVDDMNGLS